MRRELTDTWLRNVKPPAAGRLELWDTRVGVLMLRITPSGVSTWSARGRANDGRRLRVSLGTYPAVSIAEARKRALGTVAAIQGGSDPVAARRAAAAERATRAGLPTVAARLGEWQDAKAAGWSHRHAAEVKRLVNREIVPVLGKKPLTETTRADWTALVAAKRKVAPAVASLLYRVCSAFLGHAEAHGWIPAPLLPRKGLTVLAPPPVARARCLTDAELVAIWTASGQLNPKPRAFVRLLIFTAVTSTRGGGHRHRRNQPRYVRMDHSCQEGEEQAQPNPTTAPAGHR